MPATAVEPEQLLELIDDEDDVLARRQPGLAHRLEEAAAAAAQESVERGATRVAQLAGWPEHIGVVERRRHAADGILARPERCDTPAGSRLHHEPAVQGRNETRADQRRLAAARGADDREEASGPEAPQEVVHLALAPEEQVVLVRLEGPQARKGVGVAIGGHQPLRGSSAAFRRSTNGRSGSGAKPSGWLRIMASRVRNCAFAGDIGGATQMPTARMGRVRP